VASVSANSETELPDARGIHRQVHSGAFADDYDQPKEFEAFLKHRRAALATELNTFLGLG
jgi:hypothetical protein